MPAARCVEKANLCPSRSILLERTAKPTPTVTRCTGLTRIAEVVRVDDSWNTRRPVLPGDTHRCVTDSGFRCARGPTWQGNDETSRCDLDNDCDGRSDEDFESALFLPGERRPKPCVSGQGFARSPV